MRTNKLLKFARDVLVRMNAVCDVYFRQEKNLKRRGRELMMKIKEFEEMKKLIK